MLHEEFLVECAGIHAALRASSIASTNLSASEVVVSQRHFTLRRRVDRGVDARAQRAQLARADHDRPDRDLAAAEDEVVGAEQRELQLRVLDREQVLDRLGQRAVAILGRDLELAQLVLVLDEREPAVEVDLERLGGDVARRHVGVDARVDADRARREPALAGELGDDLVQHLDVELEAERGDVAGLLGAEQVAGAADLEVAHRDREARRRARCGRRASRAARAPPASARPPRDRRGRRARGRRGGRRGRGSGRAGRARACRRARRSACSPAGCRAPTR